jgi:putative ABC transport system permease protein
MVAFAQDLRVAFRELRKAPSFTLTVVLTLALGIGATTAMFSLVEGILLRPLPFQDPDRLVMLGDHLKDGSNTSVTAREIGEYSSATKAFSSMGGYTTARYELSAGDVPEAVYAGRLTAGVFPTLGVQPVLGRVFTQGEEDAHQSLAVLSYGLWVTRYHRDPHIAGSSIVLNRTTYTIIGVMPRSFEFPLVAGRLNSPQLWVPLSLTRDELSDDAAAAWGYHLVARLKDNVSVARASTDVDRVAEQIMRNFPVRMSAIHIRGDATLLLEYAVRDAQPLLRTLFLAVSIVLLIACVNVAVLLLVRAIRRRREYAVRLALGARPGALLRGALCEGLLLSMTGGLLGLGLTAVALRAAPRFLPESMPRIHSVSLNATVVLFALFLACATGILASLAPAFAAVRTNLAESIKESSRAATGASSHSWLRSALVISEIAIALVLLNMSAAFLRSYQKMLAVDPGFRPDHVLVGSYHLPVRQYATNADVEKFNRAVFAALSNQPGIVAAGFSTVLPATGSSPLADYTVEEVPPGRWKMQFAEFAATYGDYFRAMGIPLLEGRYFTVEDRSDTPLVVIVNQSMARSCWPGQQAIGKQIHAGNPRSGLPWATVVGVVADTKTGSPDEPSAEQWYFPTQQPAMIAGATPASELTYPNGGYITIRSALPPEQMIHALRSTIAAIDPQLPLDQVRSMDDAIANVEAPRRFNTSLITAFAIGALIIAVMGIYAVIAFSVSLRNQEIAVRMALGAQRSRIARLVLSSGMKLALYGCFFGVLGSLALSRLVGVFLFGVSATDPRIYLTSILVILSMAFLGSVFPASRAAGTDPIEALRSM